MRGSVGIDSRSMRGATEVPVAPPHKNKAARRILEHLVSEPIPVAKRGQWMMGTGSDETMKMVIGRGKKCVLGSQSR